MHGGLRMFWKSPCLCHNMKERRNTVPTSGRFGLN